MARFTTDISDGTMDVVLSEQDLGRIDVTTTGTIPLTPTEARIAAFELIKLAEMAEDAELERGEVGQIVRDHIAANERP